MALDFPRGWQIARAAPAEAHHKMCSFAQSDGALLCDIACPVIADNAEFRCPALHVKDGAVSAASTVLGYGACTCPAGVSGIRKDSADG